MLLVDRKKENRYKRKKHPLRKIFALAAAGMLVWGGYAGRQHIAQTWAAASDFAASYPQRVLDFYASYLPQKPTTTTTPQQKEERPTTAQVAKESDAAKQKTTKQNKTEIPKEKVTPQPSSGLDLPLDARLSAYQDMVYTYGCLEKKGDTTTRDLFAQEAIAQGLNPNGCCLVFYNEGRYGAAEHEQTKTSAGKRTFTQNTDGNWIDTIARYGKPCIARLTSLNEEAGKVLELLTRHIYLSDGDCGLLRMKEAQFRSPDGHVYTLVETAGQLGANREAQIVLSVCAMAANIRKLEKFIAEEKPGGYLAHFLEGVKKEKYGPALYTAVVGTLVHNGDPDFARKIARAAPNAKILDLLTGKGTKAWEELTAQEKENKEKKAKTTIGNNRWPQTVHELLAKWRRQHLGVLNAEAVLASREQKKKYDQAVRIWNAVREHKRKEAAAQRAEQHQTKPRSSGVTTARLPQQQQAKGPTAKILQKPANASAAKITPPKKEELCKNAKPGNNPIRPKATNGAPVRQAGLGR